MAKDALERLFEDAMNSSNNTSQYSIDDQLDVEDDFWNGMSDSSKDKLLSRITKVELDETPLEESPLEEFNDFNQNIKSALDYNSVNESEQQIKNETLETTEDSFNNYTTENSNEEEIEEEVEEKEEEKEEEPVVEQKRGRGRPRKKPLEESETNSKNNTTSHTTLNHNATEDISSLNEFMDSLARDLINELRESNYKTRNFNKKQMNVILDYLENKI